MSASHLVTELSLRQSQTLQWACSCERPYSKWLLLPKHPFKNTLPRCPFRRHQHCTYSSTSDQTGGDSPAQTYQQTFWNGSKPPICKNSGNRFASILIVSCLLFCYFAVHQKYLWIVEKTCRYFKVFSKEGSYWMLMEMSCFHFWIKRLIIAMEWTKRWEFMLNVVKYVATVSAFNYVRVVYIYWVLPTKWQLRSEP